MMNRRQDDSDALVQRDVSAVVKWYNPTKGFGFVQLDGSPDAFLHVSVVEQSGVRDLTEGARVVCDISEGRKGPQVAVIHRVDSTGAPPRGARPERDDFDDFDGDGAMVEGRVKFFNADKGFGFVSPDDGGKDVYISVRTLQRTGVAGLEPNQRVRVATRMGQKGPMADRLELL